jgi:hypothetical protein
MIFTDKASVLLLQNLPHPIGLGATGFDFDVEVGHKLKKALKCCERILGHYFRSIAVIADKIYN